MEALPYLLKVNICWVVFYGCYWMLFRRHTFFSLNRFYLLFSLIISFAIPAVELRETVTVTESAASVVTAGGQVTAGPGNTGSHTREMLLLTCYCAGVVAMLIALARSLFQIRNIIRAGISVPMQGYYLVISQRRHAPSGSFSFLRWLVISNEDYDQNFEPIFAHEMVHIRQWHSLDILLIELLKALFWFNPSLWLYKRALQDTHEFLADEQAPDRDHYATFLVSYAKNAIATSVTNQFFNSSLLRKRIHMIYRDRTPTWLRGKYLLLLPVLAVAVALMAARKYVYKERNLQPAKAQALRLTTVKGLVTEESGLPVVNAAVTFSGSFQSTVTTASGRFEIGDIPQGSVMTIDHNDFLRHTQKIGRSANEYEIRLKSNRAPVLATNSKRPEKRLTEAEETAPSIRLDRWPRFPGKTKFIANTLKYPKQALLDGAEGQVSVSFLIDTKGHVSDPKIEKGVRKDLDDEALRVVNLMPGWIPAEKNNEPVAVRYTMNITFNTAVNGLPMAVREATPGFWGNRSVYSPAKLKPIGNKHLKELFERKTVDFRDSTPPTTTLHRFWARIYRPLPEKQ